MNINEIKERIESLRDSASGFARVSSDKELMDAIDALRVDRGWTGLQCGHELGLREKQVHAVRAYINKKGGSSTKASQKPMRLARVEVAAPAQRWLRLRVGGREFEVENVTVARDLLGLG